MRCKNEKPLSRVEASLVLERHAFWAKDRQRRDSTVTGRRSVFLGDQCAESGRGKRRFCPRPSGSTPHRYVQCDVGSVVAATTILIKRRHRAAKHPLIVGQSGTPLSGSRLDRSSWRRYCRAVPRKDGALSSLTRSSQERATTSHAINKQRPRGDSLCETTRSLSPLGATPWTTIL